MGAAGASGSTGQTGTTGAQGPTGQTGAAGSAGANGATGASGATGQTGSIGTTVIAAGTSSSGTPATTIAEVDAAAGQQLVAWSLFAVHPSTANNQIKVIITYVDSSTTSVSSTAAVDNYILGNAGGVIAATTGSTQTLTTLSAKEVTKIRIETLGSGTAARIGTIAAMQVAQ
jgi:hypothetical protein